MPLSIKTEPKENRQLEVTVEVEQERVDRELRKAARNLARQYRIPGFRQGKAPYQILVQYLGLPALFNEFVEDLGQEVYRQVLDEADFEPYAPAELDIASLEPLTYSYIVPLEPEIDLGDYRALRVEEESADVVDEEVDEQIEQYREQYAGWGEVERSSQYGDMLNIDVRSLLIADASESPEGENAESANEDEETVVLDETDWDVTLDEENPMEPPGFDVQLLGMQPGEEKEFELGWPEDSQTIYAGRTARFTVRLNSIQAYEKPELDDEFAQLVGPDFQTIDDLRENIRTTLLEEKQAEAENEYLSKALDALVEQSTLVYPPVVVEDQIDSMIDEFARQLRQYGIDNLDAYLEQIGQNREEYRESLREQAEIAARRNLVISELYRLEGIEVSDEDIEERIRMITGTGDAAEESDDAEVHEETAADTEAVTAADESASSPPDTSLGDVDEETAAGDTEEPGPKAEAVHDETSGDIDTGDEGDVEDEETAEAASVRAFADMMRSGSGRSILESQILQEKALERLLAIVRGEELPPPAPQDNGSDNGEASAQAPEGDGSGESDDAAQEPVTTEES